MISRMTGEYSITKLNSFHINVNCKGNMQPKDSAQTISAQDLVRIRIEKARVNIS